MPTPCRYSLMTVRKQHRLETVTFAILHTHVSGLIYVYRVSHNPCPTLLCLSWCAPIGARNVGSHRVSDRSNIDRIRIQPLGTNWICIHEFFFTGTGSRYMKKKRIRILDPHPCVMKNLNLFNDDFL